MVQKCERVVGLRYRVLVEVDDGMAMKIWGLGEDIN